jgi:hypothetical protein
VVFDPQSATEANCDYVIIWKDSDRSDSNKWTASNLTGRLNSNNFPGICGRDPMTIPADHCDITFHSDGSQNDWGVKITVYGVMEVRTLSVHTLCSHLWSQTRFKLRTDPSRSCRGGGYCSCGV